MPDDFYEIYVIDPQPQAHRADSRCTGCSAPAARCCCATIMATDVRAIPAETDQEEVGHVFDQYDLVSAPVIGKLPGA